MLPEPLEARNQHRSNAQPNGFEQDTRYPPEKERECETIARSILTSPTQKRRHQQRENHDASTDAAVFHAVSLFHPEPGPVNSPFLHHCLENGVNSALVGDRFETVDADRALRILRRFDFVAQLLIGVGLCAMAMVVIVVSIINGQPLQLLLLIPIGALLWRRTRTYDRRRTNQRR